MRRCRTPESPPHRGPRRASDDPGAKLLTVFLVRHAEHLNILDLRMRVQELFDLAWIDVLAAPDHHVLDAADDTAIALVVDRCEVAVCIHLAASMASRVSFSSFNNEHHRVAARAQLAGLAARTTFPLVSTILTSRCGCTRPTSRPAARANRHGCSGS